jgi:hypothetical protein
MLFIGETDFSKAPRKHVGMYFTTELCGAEYEYCRKSEKGITFPKI